MKKLVILFAAILPFLFFSCASDSGIPEDSAKNETELTENLEESSVQDSEPSEFSDNNTQTELEPVEIITEPEIITLEPEEETDTKNDDKTTETTENEDVELVIDSDLILPDADVDFTNKTDESENSQNSDKGTENSENEGLSDISADNENQNTEESSQTTTENISTENNDENVTTNEELDFTGNDSDNSDDLDNSENSDDLDNSDDSDETEKTEETEEAEEETIEEIVPVPSRTVSLKRGETLIVIYPGSGWIYLGSTSEYNNLTSKGRKLGSTDTTYTLLAKEPGTQLHHFYKTDNLTGNYIDDYLEVTVLDAKGKSSTKITAPSYAEVIPPRPEQIQKNQESAVHSDDNSGNLQNKSDSQVQESTSVQNDSEKLKDESHPNTDSKQNETSYNYDSEDDIEFLDDEEEEKSAPVENTDELLEQAKSLYNEKKYTEANTCLSVFFEYASTRRDEALYLQGQIYESESSVKDIKKAVETYKNLIQNYPASPYWDKANKRIIYLNRFYFEAR